MKTTLRMPPELEQRLTLWAQRLEMSRQELVVQALQTQLGELEQRAGPDTAPSSCPPADS